MSLLDLDSSDPFIEKLAFEIQQKRPMLHPEWTRLFHQPKYVNACTKDEEFRSWREFFRQVSVKDAPDNGVEDFAMNFAIEQLQALFNSIEAVDKRNFGYDLQALDQKSEKVHIEVKGLSSDGDVELTGNEAEAANIHRDRFYLCVVSGIPNLPVLRLVQNPALIGLRDKLTIRQADWQAGRPVP